MDTRELWRTIGLAVAAALLCLGLTLGLSFAQQQGTTAQGVPYYSGGVGEDERAAMDAMAGQYNLKLEFARQDRAMLGSVQVTLAGPVTTSLVSEGPVLMLRLPPGVYTVTGVVGGVAKTTKAEVGKTGLHAAALFW